MEKTLNNTNPEQAKKNVPDIQFFGKPCLFTLIGKASSEKQGWMKSTKAMEVKGGCVVQVTTQQKNPNGNYVIAEALTFVPDVQLHEDSKGNIYLG